MFLLKVLLFALGAALVFWGFMISVVGRYDLFPFFEKRCRRGSCSDSLVVSSGRIFMAVGAACCAFAMASFMFGKWFVKLAYIVCFVGGAGWLICNEIKHARTK